MQSNRLMTATTESCRLAEGADPSVLADIYNDGIDIAIWKRDLSASIADTVAGLVSCNPSFRLSVAVTPDNACDTLTEALSRYESAGPNARGTPGDDSAGTYNSSVAVDPALPTGAMSTGARSTSARPTSAMLSEDIAELVDMFCLLFDVKSAGVRLGVLESAMCPKFHVDRIPCRLLTTYQGVATEWLPHELVDRSKLGHGSNGLPDHESGLFDCPDAIQQLNQGDVAILKGDLWEGNEGNGLVHRSPDTDCGHRLLLTMDLIN
jgi:hypothetical protein